MLEWYEPDKRSAFVGNFNTKEAFAEKQVVRGHFHALVPEDIVKSYKTVEYLMAHAWYHWPMFDEALRKLLGMVEMAVKQRSVALEIDMDFEYSDKYGKKKKGKKNFYRLIEDLSGKEPQKALKNWLHDVRWLRNHFSHPDGKTLMGGLVIGKIKNIINLINLIFLDEEVCKAAKEKSAHFEEAHADFKDGLFILEQGKARFLVTEMKVLEAFQAKSDWVCICFFCPVFMDAFNHLSNHTYPPHPILALMQLDVKEGVFEANDFETGAPVKLYPTTHPDNQTALRIFQEELEQLNSEDHSLFHVHLADECGGKVRDLMYQLRWSV
jgi:hypothetical protein